MMRQRLCCFLVVLLLMFYGEIFGQKNPEFFHLTINNQASVGIDLPSHFSLKVINSAPWKGQDFGIKQAPAGIPMISSSCYTSQLGFFCKKELQLEKITSVPFRFRLGSLDYVNYLEQKPNASRHP